MKPRIENLVDNEGYGLFNVDSTVVLVWKQLPVMEAINENRKLFADLRRKRPKDKIGYLAVVEERAGLEMPANVRDSLTQMLKDNQETIGASAVVFEGKGFRASIVRTAVATINLVAKNDFKSKVESDLDAATNWLVRTMGTERTVSGPELAAVINEFRGRVPRSAAR